MENNKKVMFLLNQVKKKQKEVDELLEQTMKVIGTVIKVDCLEESKKEQLRKEAKTIISKFIQKYGNVLEEEEQRQLFIELKDVNYSRNGLAYVLRDCGIDIQYMKGTDPLAWKPMKLTM